MGNCRKVKSRKALDTTSDQCVRVVKIYLLCADLLVWAIGSNDFAWLGFQGKGADAHGLSARVLGCTGTRAQGQAAGAKARRSCSARASHSPF